MGAVAKKLDWNTAEILEEFATFPLFETFPKNLLAELATASEIILLPKLSEILQQGQKNDQIYFLSHGCCGVYVDGARVNKLQGKGDLLGEMSVITKRPVGATIIAETEVTLVRVDSRHFLNMSGPERDAYLSVLYRVYATVLSEKLNTTNQKAKHFEQLTVQLTSMQWDLEEANRNLEKKVEERTQKLEHQKAELTVGKNKLEELVNSKKFIFQKLSQFHDKNLIPLKTFLDNFRKNHPNEPEVNDARQVVFDVQRMLGPLTDQYSSEQAIHSKKVLLAEGNKKQQIVAKMALGGTGVILDICSTLEEGLEKLKSTKYDMVAFDNQMVELGNVAKELNPSADLVLLTSASVPDYLPSLKQLSGIPNIVSRNEEDRTFTVKNIMTTVTKLLSRDLFGLEKYLTWGVDIQSNSITSSQHRAKLIDEVDAYFEKLGVRRSNRERMRAVLEEMLMNAIYDAPASKEGKPLYNHLSRSEQIVLKPEEQGLLRWATDGMLLAVSVQDPFGSLKGSIILKYLERNYAGMGAGVVEEGKGGAGRGLHQIVENSDLVVFNIDPGKKTEVIALFNVEVKEAQNHHPTFHLFVKS
jgi:CRP-like cAMP-binding protein